MGEIRDEMVSGACVQVIEETHFGTRRSREK